MARENTTAAPGTASSAAGKSRASLLDSKRPDGEGTAVGSTNHERIVKQWSDIVDACEKGEESPKLNEVVPYVADIISEMIEKAKERDERIVELEQDVQISGTEAYEVGLELRNTRKELDESKKMVGELTLQAHTQKERTASPTPQPSSTIGQRSEKLPDPEVFKDGTHAEYRSWERQMFDKLEINADRIGGERQQVAYASSRIGGTAASFMEPFLDRTNSQRVKSVEEFFDRLRKRFADPFSRDSARVAFRSLYQGRKEFQEFLGEFYRLSVEGGYSEEEQLEALREKIAIHLKDALVGYRPANLTLQSYVEQLQWVDREQQSIRRDKAKIEQKKRENSSAQTRATTSTRQAASPSPVAVELEAKPLKRNKSDIRCYNCQKMGHFATECSGKESAPAKS